MNSNRGQGLHMAASPLPPGWEQYLDLESGKIYYVNRVTDEKTWEDPRKGKTRPTARRRSSGDRRVNLNTHLSNVDENADEENEGDCECDSEYSSSSSSSQAESTVSSGDANDVRRSSEMLVIACWRCHMFVMISKNSPVCPNCKHVHSPSEIAAATAAASSSAQTNPNNRK